MTGSHNIKVGLPADVGHLLPHGRRQRRPLPDLPERREQRRHGRAVHARPDRSLVRNTPVASRRGAELRPRHLRAGLVDAEAADASTPASATSSSTRRCSTASRRPAGSCRRASFAEVKNLPDWSDWAPRFALVYDVFGNAKTALKYSLNRYNLARTTGIADRLQPAGVDDADALVERRERRRHRAGRQPGGQRRAAELRVPVGGLRDQLRATCRRTSASLALNDVRRLPAHLEPRARRSSCSTSCCRGCR